MSGEIERKHMTLDDALRRAGWVLKTDVPPQWVPPADAEHLEISYDAEILGFYISYFTRGELFTVNLTECTVIVSGEAPTTDDDLLYVTQLTFDRNLGRLREVPPEDAA